MIIVLIILYLLGSCLMYMISSIFSDNVYQNIVVAILWPIMIVLQIFIKGKS